jgi:hypothetical protein
VKRKGAGYFGQYLLPLRSKSLPLWTVTKIVKIKKEKNIILLITTKQNKQQRCF